MLCQRPREGRQELHLLAFPPSHDHLRPPHAGLPERGHARSLRTQTFTKAVFPASKSDFRSVTGLGHRHFGQAAPLARMPSRQAEGGTPIIFLKARLNEASDS